MAVFDNSPGVYPHKPKLMNTLQPTNPILWDFLDLPAPKSGLKVFTLNTLRKVIGGGAPGCKPDSGWKLDVIEELIVIKICRRSEEASYLHHFRAGVLQHVNLSLREEHCAALLDVSNFAFYPDPTTTGEQIDDLFPVWMRMRRLHGLPGLYFDNAHTAILGIDVLFGDDPTQHSARQIQRFNALFIDDW